jgi:diketogulonate reductase-like aldo/keto reductase/flavodoxin
MKKNVFISVMLMAYTFLACAQGGGRNTQSSGTGNTPAGRTMKTLVVYFSCTGTTETVASYIAGETGGKRYKIVPETPYTSADLNYSDNNSRATREQNNASARPAIKNDTENIEEYDVIFLGYPIWWGQAPKIMYTFLESHDFSGKTIIPFCTSHSSGIGSSDTNLRALAPSAHWISGRRFSSGASRAEVSEWINSLNLKFSESVSSFNLSIGENGKAPTVMLNSGYDMPIVGLGTYSLLGDVCVNSVVSALQSGFRKIDTAYMYNNEKSVGEGVKKSGVPREEVFVATKLYPNQYSNPEAAINEALEKLNIGYIDLMLLHHPGSNDVKAYKAMEKAVAEGKIRSIGLSNWYIKEINEFLPKITIMPALNQNEIHPYYQENNVIPYFHNLGIVMEAWYPLGGRGYTGALLNNETIVAIARAHNRSSAQVILRWDLQKGVVVIPGSSNPDHIKENISLFNFELTDEEMNRINALDRNEKHDWY